MTFCYKKQLKFKVLRKIINCSYQITIKPRINNDNFEVKNNLLHMKSIALGLIFCALLQVSCSKDDHSSKDKDLKELEALYKEIDLMSKSNICVNAADWAFTAIGSKACGGPTNFIAYSTKLNTVEFLKKVQAYTEAQDKFNKKWRIYSDCMLIAMPQRVDCVNGKAELIY